MSWLTQFPVNPLAIGQYVNNQSAGEEPEPISIDWLESGLKQECL